MENENRLLLFLICDGEIADIAACRAMDEVVSVYHVSGAAPWLMVCGVSQVEDALRLIGGCRLDIKHMSVAIDSNIVDKLSAVPGKDCESKGMLFWVFLKDLQRSTRKESRDELRSLIGHVNGLSNDATENSSDLAIAAAYETFGEWDFVVKISASNIVGLDSFLRLCQQREMSTSATCVLSALKEHGRDIEEPLERRKARAEAVRKEPCYAVARLIATTEGFMQRDKAEQRWLLQDKLPDMGVDFAEGYSSYVPGFGLDPSRPKSEYNRDDLGHPLIDRCSIELERPGWLKALLFFKAAPGLERRDRLEELLAERLLGVAHRRFARKLYRRTGEYDFMVPMDCKHLEALTAEVDKFIRESGSLVVGFASAVCRPVSEAKAGESLKQLDLPLVEALLINAAGMEHLEQSLREKAFLSTILRGEELRPAERGVTPREDYVRYKFRDEAPVRVKAYVDAFSSFADIGIKSRVEFRKDAVIQALVKFGFRDDVSRLSLLREIESRREAHDIIVTTYEPVTEPLTLTCVLVVKDLVELDVILDELRGCYHRVESHLILHRRSYSRVLGENIRCRPCFYPQVLEGDREYAKQNCAKCVRYIVPRNANTILNVDFGSRLDPERETKIALVGVDLTIAEGLALDESLDEALSEGFSELLGNSKRDGSYGLIFAGYQGIVDKRAFRDSYRVAVMETLKGVLDSRDSPDIIVFPEHAISSYVYEEIKNTSIKKECVIVAGTHRDRSGFFVSPVIFNDSFKKEIYHLYKNILSPFEQNVGVRLNQGTGHLRFLNTKFGNVYAQVCYDSYAICDLGRVDMWLVPAYNDSPQVVSHLGEQAKVHKLVVAYANAARNEGELESRFFVPSREGQAPSPQGVAPFHEDQWSKTSDCSEKLFYVSEAERERRSDFTFLVKHLRFHISELDRRRAIRSRYDRQKGLTH